MERARYIVIHLNGVKFHNWNNTSSPPQNIPTKVFAVEYPDRYRITHEFGSGWLIKLTPDQINQRLIKNYLMCLWRSLYRLKLRQARMFLQLSIHRYKKR